MDTHQENIRKQAELNLLRQSIENHYSNALSPEANAKEKMQHYQQEVGLFEKVDAYFEKYAVSDEERAELNEFHVAQSKSQQAQSSGNFISEDLTQKTDSLNEKQAQQESAEKVETLPQQHARLTRAIQLSDLKIEEYTRRLDVMNNGSSVSGDLTQEEYTKFVNEGRLSPERLDNLAGKIMEKSALSPEEMAVIADSDTMSLINSYIKCRHDEDYRNSKIQELNLLVNSEQKHRQSSVEELMSLPEIGDKELSEAIEQTANEESHTQGSENTNNRPVDVDLDNLFDNNMFDIHSIADLQNLKNISILSKKGEERIQFEFGDDFWKYENGKLTQYADFVSMRNDKGGVDATLTDYGLAIMDSVKSNKELLQMEDFTLQDRENYIKGNVSGELRTLEFKGIKREMDEIGRALKPNIKQAELQDISSITNAVIDVLALSFALLKAGTNSMKKENMSNQILSNLDQKKKNEYLRNPELLREIPQLRTALQKTDEYVRQFTLHDKYKDMKEIDKTNAILNYALTNKDVLGGVDKLTDSSFFKKHHRTLNNHLDALNTDLQKEFSSLTNYLKDNDVSQTLFLENFTQENFEKMLKQLDINPKNDNESKEFIAAMHFIKSNCNDSKDLSFEYQVAMMRFFPSKKEVNSLNFNNVKDIVDKIAEKILKLDIAENQKQGSGMRM